MPTNRTVAKEFEIDVALEKKLEIVETLPRVTTWTMDEYFVEPIASTAAVDRLSDAAANRDESYCRCQ